MTSVERESTPAATARSSLATPILSFSLNVVTPPTVAADVSTPNNSRPSVSKRSKAKVASFSPVRPHKEHRTSSNTHKVHSVTADRSSKVCNEKSSAILASPPGTPLSPSHCCLLEVIQRQQARIVALQRSLLYATELTRRVSHPFSFQQPLEGGPEVSALTEAAAAHIYPPSSLPVSPIKAVHLADAPLAEPSAAAAVTVTPTAAVRCFSRDRAVVGNSGSPVNSSIAPRSARGTSSLLSSADLSRVVHLNVADVKNTQEITSTNAVVNEKAHTDGTCSQAGHQSSLPSAAALLWKPEVTAPSDTAVVHRHPLPPPFRSASLATVNPSTACSSVASAPRTHCVFTATAKHHHTLSYDDDVDVSVDAVDETIHTTDDEADNGGDRSAFTHHRQKCCSEHTEAEGCSKEVARLRRQIEELTASHLRLRLRCARHACARRETSDGLRAMMGCVQAALDDVVCDTAAQPVPHLILNVLEYVLRQCTRSLQAANGNAEEPPIVAPLLPFAEKNAKGGEATVTSPRSSSTSEAARRYSVTPDIILHRLRDRMYS